MPGLVPEPGYKTGIVPAFRDGQAPETGAKSIISYTMVFDLGNCVLRDCVPKDSSGKAPLRKGHFTQGVKTDGKSTRWTVQKGAYVTQWLLGCKARTSGGEGALLGHVVPPLLEDVLCKTWLASFFRASGISLQHGMARPCDADGSEKERE